MTKLIRLVLILSILPAAQADELDRLATLVELDGRRAASEEKRRDEALTLAKAGVPATWVKARDAETAKDRKRVARLVAYLADRLDGRAVIAADLRAFLGRDDAAAILYHDQVRPLTRRDRLSRALAGVFKPTDDGRRARIPEADAYLDRARKAEPISVDEGEAFAIRALGRMYARQLTGDVEGWTKLLTTDDVFRLAALAPPPRTIDAAKVLLDHSEFGRMLVRGTDGRYAINAHCHFEMDELLRRIGAIASFRDLAADWQIRGRTFEAEATGELDSTRVKAVRAELGTPMSLELAKLEYDGEGVDLLKSSAFYNPRTGYGTYWWSAAFDDHPTARLFGTFGWNAKTTKSVAEFLAKIDAQLPRLRRLAETHDNLIIVINTMPPWLSTAPDSGTFEGERRENAEAHPPRDPKLWHAMIKGMVDRLKKVENVNWYYEFWNEPDGQYWQSGLDEFLELYAITARTIRAADPRAKVGGCAPNQWDGKLKRARDRELINVELIRFAAKEKLPLDFVSWHHFGRPVEAIAQAKARYTKELDDAGFDPRPEFLVTEWSTAYRGMPYAATHFGELMLGFFRAKLEIQTIACWEEFHAKPDPKHYAPWGLLTQQGVRKGTWYAHRFFDRIARESGGVAVVTDDQKRTVVVSKKADGVFDLLVWQKGLDPAYAAALETLQAGGFTKEHGRVYWSYDRLERAIIEGAPVPAGLEKAFAAAGEIHRKHPVQTPRLVLRFAGAKSVEILFAESVRMGHEMKRPVVRGNLVTCPLRRHEVLHLTVRVR